MSISASSNKQKSSVLGSPNMGITSGPQIGITWPSATEKQQFNINIEEVSNGFVVRFQWSNVADFGDASQNTYALQSLDTLSEIIISEIAARKIKEKK